MQFIHTYTYIQETLIIFLISLSLFPLLSVYYSYSPVTAFRQLSSSLALPLAIDHLTALLLIAAHSAFCCCHLTSLRCPTDRLTSCHHILSFYRFYIPLILLLYSLSLPSLSIFAHISFYYCILYLCHL